MVMLKQLDDLIKLEYLIKLLNLEYGVSSQTAQPAVSDPNSSRCLENGQCGPATEARQEYQQRPSSSFSALTNTLEALFLPSIRRIYLLAEHEHGFRPQHSTTTTFHSISTNISVCNPRLIKGV